MKKFIFTDWARHYKYEVEAENEEQAIDIIWRVKVSYEAKKELGSRAYTHICFTLDKVKNRSERDIREWNSITVFGEEDLYPPM